MHKRHAPSKLHGLTMCGYECTTMEYRTMQRRGKKFVSCSKCLEALEFRELLKDGEI